MINLLIGILVFLPSLAVAERFTLQDATGVVLPGVSYSGDGRLFNQAEGTYASYGFYGGWGMSHEVIFYNTADCTGSPFVMSVNPFSNYSEVFTNQGSRWIVKNTTSTQNIKSGWTDSYDQCYQLGAGNKTVSDVTPYSGVFPLSPQGPYLLRNISAESSYGNSIIGEGAGTLTPDKSRVTSFDLGEAASLTRIRAYVVPSIANQSVRAVIYSDKAGVPDQLLAASEEILITANTDPLWVTGQLTKLLQLKPGKYWMGLHSGPSASPARYRFSNTTKSRYSSSDLYSDGPNPVFGKAESILTGTMSIYAIYVPDTGIL